jgi:hypothetical protein
MRNSRDRLQFVQEVLTIDVVEAASCKVKTNDALHKKDIVVSPPFNPLPHCFRFRRHLSFDPAAMEAIDIVWVWYNCTGMICTFSLCTVFARAKIARSNWRCSCNFTFHILSRYQCLVMNDLER